MYEYISGPVAEVAPAYAVIDAGGVGYYLHISLETFSAIEHTETAQIALVLRKEERQLHLLQGEGVVGAYDVGARIVGVVFGHEARRDVDAHHPAFRLVDVFHQRGETAA